MTLQRYSPHVTEILLFHVNIITVRNVTIPSQVCNGIAIISNTPTLPKMAIQLCALIYNIIANCIFMRIPSTTKAGGKIR